MILQIKKTYGSNFDLIRMWNAATPEQDKVYIKVIKNSDEVQEPFSCEDFDTGEVMFNGISDCEFSVGIDTDKSVTDSLGNMYFQIIE